MKIAIHNHGGKFQERWVSYCQRNNVPLKLVNCYEHNIIDQLIGCDGLMWHLNHNDYKDVGFAKQLINSLKYTQVKTYPNWNTVWHFDDKVGQKYLFDALGIPHAQSYVFYSKQEVLSWLRQVDFPIVFKLSGGAGSMNVHLVNNLPQAQKIVKRAFGRGFSAIDSFHSVKQQLWLLKSQYSPTVVKGLVRSLYRLAFKTNESQMMPRHMGYVLFQEFIKANEFDDRVVVIGEKAVAIRRYVRDNDFRASGSGLIDIDHNLFDINVIKLAFNITNSIGAQVLAFDFVYDDKKQPTLIEICYAFSMGYPYDDISGYWDSSLIWHEGKIDLQQFMIEDFIAELALERSSE